MMGEGVLQQLQNQKRKKPNLGLLRTWRDFRKCFAWERILERGERIVVGF